MWIKINHGSVKRVISGLKGISAALIYVIFHLTVNFFEWLWVFLIFRNNNGIFLGKGKGKFLIRLGKLFLHQFHL